jgi:hypothetical protein
MIKEESWKWVVGHEGWLEVSDLGNVRSYKGTGRIPKKRDTPRPIKGCKDGRGYFNFSVRENGKPKVLLIHIEEAKAFLPNPKRHKLVRHLDDIKTNNELSNLAWGTFQDNREDGIRNGRHFHKKGVCPVQAKLTKSIVLKIMKSKATNVALAKKYGVSESCVSKVRVGRGWNNVTKLPRKK